MELKELKKEINGLADINKILFKFKDAWLKPIKENTNKQFLFLQKLDQETKKEINALLSSHQKIFDQLKYAQFINEKLSSLAHYLIELKLSFLNRDEKKSKVLINKFINDDFLKLKNLVDEASQFGFNLKNLRQVYGKVNKILLQSIPLKHSLIFMDSSHKSHLNSLFLASRKQKKLLGILGKEFISLVREMKKKKRL